MKQTSYVILALVALISGCESTSYPYQKSKAYWPNQVDLARVCSAQIAPCHQVFLSHWDALKRALFPRKSWFVDNKSHQPSNYVTQAALTYWGSLQQVEKQDCPANYNTCPTYKLSDLQSPVAYHQYRHGLLSQFGIPEKHRDFSYTTKNVQHITFTNQGHCPNSPLGTAQSVCAYLNAPSMAEQTGIINNHKPNPYNNDQKLSGSYALFEIHITNNELKQQGVFNHSIVLHIAVPGDKNTWQQQSWAQIQDALKRAVVVFEQTEEE
ncbi:hypothetical protein DS891_22770 [Pseudoalteromonas sp. JC28]|uniref:hypothetical protein n=1 Tax=Pseudoalteromonas sp. JC28 TaxID=2267617 RepID=UPI0015733C53|nr:hypothetical protein [Pseudoalteromonas sp. JC28]NSY36316.1 hypothetical protein [Pseudoalteromonas sp. JC28]